MAHQWFGDLVTMKWWNDVWLNEGFATWMTPKALESWNPAKDQKSEIARQKAFVLEADARASTRPIRANGETPAEIKQLFDGIAYEKGASVLHMMEAYLGEETFRKGINAYLGRYQNGNATSEDFWTELERASGRPVSRIMTSFVNQAGAPVVSFACSAQKCEFKQQRYQTKTGAKQKSSTWSMPICMRTVDAKDARCEVVSKNQQALNSPQSPFIANAGSTGYYRTAYTSAELDAIRSKWNQVSAPERIGIYDDEWAMVRAGRAQITDYLTLSQSLRSESDPNVVAVVLPRLRDIRLLLSPEQEQQYNVWLIRQLPTGDGSGHSNGSDDQQKELESQLFSARAEAKDAATLKEADELTAKFLQDPASVDPTLASSALRASAAHGNAALYDQIEQKWKSAPTPELNFRYLTLLASFRDPQLVDRSLAILLSPQMREQDVPFFLSGLLRNPAARDKAWQALRDHWDELKGKIVSFGGSGPVATLAEYCSEEKAKEVRSFFDDHSLPGAERSIKGAIEEINECTALKKSQGPRLANWLASAH
jgi:aminopeptidase N/puromycin-sensitive aminopeptidase